jgi:hypothetical protein
MGVANSDQNLDRLSKFFRSFIRQFPQHFNLTSSLLGLWLAY